MPNTGSGESGTPWQVWAIVTIIAALIGAYATLNTGKSDTKPSSEGNNPIVIAQTTETINLSGTWDGALYQQLPNATLAQFPYQLSLSQDGNSVEGTAQLTVPPPYGYSATMKIRGTLSGKTLRFDDGQMIANSAPLGWVWCQKTVRLTYNAESNILEGSWNQSGCGSGSVSLRR